MSFYQTSWNKRDVSVNKFQEIWENAAEATEHPYLTRKNISAHGIGISGDNLIIPIHIDDVVSGIQTIAPDGTKKFMPSSNVSGGYYALEGTHDVIYIAEGFATSASIHEQTGATTICAFSAGNLPKVAVAIRKLLEKSTIIIAADGDESGIKFAEQAARECNGSLVYAPEGKDFNDVSIKDFEPLAPPIKEVVVKKEYDVAKYDKDFEKEEIQEYLSFIKPDQPYDVWIKIGMAIKAAGGSLTDWDNWSKPASTYKQNDCAKHWGSFKNLQISPGTLVYFAKEGGWIRGSKTVKDKEVAVVDIKSIIENASKKAVKILSPKPNVDDIHFDGLIGDTVNWINDKAIFKQPMLATLNVLAALGAVFGRRYASKLNTRTNIYLVSICATGSGKDFSRKLVSNLMHEAGLSNYLGDNGVRSDSGLVKSLKANASQVMMIDEFGMFLAALKDNKSASHIKAVGRLFIELYSTSSSIYKHGTYATDKMESMVLNNPNLCVYGTTTEEAYAAALSKDGIKNGELNRFIVLPGLDDSPPCHDAQDTQDIPTELIEAWRAFTANPSDNNLAASNDAGFAPKPVIIGWGKCWPLMCELLDYQYSKRNEPHGALWARYRENIIKIAMIYALSEFKFEMEEKHVVMARKFVEKSIIYMENLAKRHMAENQWEELYNEFIEIIAKHGGEIKKSDLANTMKKVRRRDFNEMLESMKEGDVIDIENRLNPNGGGRPTVYIKLA